MGGVLSVEHRLDLGSTPVREKGQEPAPETELREMQPPTQKKWPQLQDV